MTMVERVAGAIAHAIHPGVDCWRAYEGAARRAVAALAQPTAAMIEAGQDEVLGGLDSAEFIYKAMIAAALAEKP